MMREFPHHRQRRRSPGRSLAIALVAGALAGAAAHAQAPSRVRSRGEATARAQARHDARPTIAQCAMAAPPSVEVVVALDDAARLRRTPVGLAVASALSEASGEPFRAAWNDLARTLGWAPEEAFDALLGSRATLMARGLGGPDAQWVVISEVTSSVERRLRERLDVSPRRIASGSPILSIEHGRYELAICRRPGGAALALAPSAASGLFDEITPTLGGAHAGAPDANVAPGPFARLSGGDAIALLRSRGCADSQTALVLQVKGDRLCIESVLESERLRGKRAALAPWPRGLFTRLSEGALLAMVERTAAASEGESALGEALGGIPALALGPEHTALVGDRVALLAVPEGDGMSVGFALAMRSASSASALVDRLAAEMMARCGAPGQDFGGLAPPAVRTVSLSNTPAASTLLRRCAGTNTALRWSFPASARPAPLGGVRDAALDEIPDDRGWLVAGLGEGAHARFVADIDRTVRPCEGEAEDDGDGSRVGVRRWVSMGVARPREILARLGQIPEGAPAHLVAVARIVEFAEWTFRLSREETLLGEATITVAPVASPSSLEPAPMLANKAR